MKLSDLLRTLPHQRVSGSLQREITGLALDSRQVREGFAFVACKGAVTDGHRFAADAVQRGAAAVLCSDAISPLPEHVAAVRMECSPTVCAQLAQRFYGQPACALIGITGTNGKTTSAYLTRYLLEQAGWPCGLLGTVVYEFGARSIPAARTTPDVFELHRLLHQMAAAGARAVVMEVSSHALVQQRVGNLTFDAAVFTNLTQDHLDFHHTMEEYYRAKRMLFDRITATPRVPGRAGIVMIDDMWGQRLAGELRSLTIEPLTLSISGTRGADIRAESLQLSSMGCTFDLHWQGTVYRNVRINLLGRHNVANTLCAMAAAAACGVSIEAMITAAARMPAVPGRLEFIANNLGITVVVDYAHTDDALRSVLQCLREITQGALWAVFGCGGDRDRGKRPRMGAAAEELADHVIVTSDNPRSEDPQAIAHEICAGMRQAPYAVELDRRAAIARACAAACPGDVILIAGKGHETYQEIKRVFYDYDDRTAARAVLAELEAARVHA